MDQIKSVNNDKDYNDTKMPNIWNNETSVCEYYRLSKECLIKAKNSNHFVTEIKRKENCEIKIKEQL